MDAYLDMGLCCQVLPLWYEEEVVAIGPSGGRYMSDLSGGSE